MNSLFLKLATVISFIFVIIDNSHYSVYSLPTSVQNKAPVVENKSVENTKIDENRNEKERMLLGLLLHNPNVLVKLEELESPSSSDSSELGVESNREYDSNNEKALDEEDAGEDGEYEFKDNNANLDRSRRRISVFKNVYNKCRIQKRKEKNWCLYLANLYQNVKGFHGI